MKQGVLRGFGAAHLSAAVPPQDMPADVLAMCRSEADAILHSINFAKRRFGYTQLDIARLCGWTTDNHLSEYKRNREVRMPDKHRRRFAQVTGSNLLEQYELTQQTQRRASGNETANERNEAVVARMLQVAA
jgi:hypothetical protein